MKSKTQRKLIWNVITFVNLFIFNAGLGVYGERQFDREKI